MHLAEPPCSQSCALDVNDRGLHLGRASVLPLAVHLIVESQCGERAGGGGPLGVVLPSYCEVKSKSQIVLVVESTTLPNNARDFAQLVYIGSVPT
ncbi:hypothetical protein BHE74_00043281 [Ensete ventricosum]|nr:hypothetical protein BHE74_00043281 [Ensete ventricosum]